MASQHEYIFFFLVKYFLVLDFHEMLHYQNISIFFIIRNLNIPKIYQVAENQGAPDTFLTG